MEIELVELKQTDCNFGTCYQPVVKTPNGGRYQYTGTLQLTEETGREQVEKFDPEGRKWEHVSGPEYSLPKEGDDEEKSPEPETSSVAPDVDDKHKVSHGVDREPKMRGKNTTGPGGCPHCGGPTSVSGQPCESCM